MHVRYLELSDVLCPNETELALLCKGDIDPEDEGSVQAGAKELIARGEAKWLEDDAQSHAAGYPRASAVPVALSFTKLTISCCRSQASQRMQKFR